MPSWCQLATLICHARYTGAVADEWSQWMPTLASWLHRRLSWWQPKMPWWLNQMEIFSALLALCAGNSPVTGEFPSQRPVTRSIDVSLICAWINGWVTNREAGDSRRYRAHYGVTLMAAGDRGMVTVVASPFQPPNWRCSPIYIVMNYSDCFEDMIWWYCLSPFVSLHAFHQNYPSDNSVCIKCL